MRPRYAVPSVRNRTSQYSNEKPNCPTENTYVSPDSYIMSGRHAAPAVDDHHSSMAQYRIRPDHRHVADNPTCSSPLDVRSIFLKSENVRTQSNANPKQQCLTKISLSTFNRIRALGQTNSVSIAETNFPTDGVRSCLEWHNVGDWNFCNVFWKHFVHNWGKNKKTLYFIFTKIIVFFSIFLYIHTYFAFVIIYSP